MEEFHCRTCLTITYINKATQITKKCYRQKTIKDVIVYMVPEMEETLVDEEFVCGKCLETIKNVMNFIERCLDVECILAQNRDHLVEEDGEVEGEQFVKQELHFYEETSNLSAAESQEAEEALTDTGKPIQIVFDDSMYIEEGDDQDEEVLFRRRVQGSPGITPQVTCVLCVTRNGRIPRLRPSHGLAQIEEAPVCGYCKKLFISKKALNVHLSVAHQVYMCRLCYKVFKQKFKLDYHVKMVHLKMGRTECSECGKLFQNKEAMDSHHRLVHQKIKPFICHVCAREFGRRIIC
ncbi:hypothetical protein NQ317_001593 [Molorchus minor]|uniref:C2H2-type domain-containing protein n=1 Tax=Molorchus minor TaxID=1323400 RepID=A0ABQ9IVN0_9CUCU|nr:hypothetical protein NQ317_001593 [Molorchus minor]